MKAESLKKRLVRNRPKVTVSIPIPEDVIEDLERVAPLLGFDSYEALIRAYIGQGLRTDLERLESGAVVSLVSSLRRPGVNEMLIQEALNEAIAGRK